jgi:hypothetical protein
MMGHRGWKQAAEKVQLRAPLFFGLSRNAGISYVSRAVTYGQRAGSAIFTGSGMEPRPFGGAAFSCPVGKMGVQRNGGGLNGSGAKRGARGMKITTWTKLVAGVVGCVAWSAAQAALTVSVGSGNELDNPGFEGGEINDSRDIGHWAGWGNAYRESILPLSGFEHIKAFGNWQSDPDFSGFLQDVDAAAG